MPIASAFCAAPRSYIWIRKLRKPIEPLVSVSACGESPALTTGIPGTAECSRSATVFSISEYSPGSGGPPQNFG